MIRAALIVAVLALATLAILRNYDLRTPAATASVAASTPRGSDYYMRDASIRQMSATGQPEYQLRATQILHYPDDSARLVDIQLHYPKAAGTAASGPWDLYADSGTIPAGQHDILLSRNVRLVRTHAGGDDRLTTSHVWIRPDAHRINTNAAITITGPGRQAHAQGMTIYLDSNKVTFNGNVQVTYQP